MYAVAVLLALVGCAQPTSMGSDADRSSGPAPEMLSFGPVSVGPGEESDDLCASWTLDLDDPLFVSAVRSENGDGIHHSNWFWVPPSLYGGPDGVWSCAERGFDGVGAGIAGGIIFGTSTQSPEDEQRFSARGALRIPRRARIVANVHVLNASASPIDASLRLHLETLAEDDVGAQMNILGFTYEDLQLDPRAVSEFTTECDLGAFYRAQAGSAPDFNLYYALSHYHELGVAGRVEVVGGARDGEVLFASTSIGEPLSESFPEPLSLAGVERLRFTCRFDNPRDEVVGYGIGDQEMCAIGFYSDSPFKMAAFVTETTRVEEVDGVFVHHGACEMLGQRPL